MNSGGTRGNGGRGLVRHWTKDKNERVEVLPGRDLASDSLVDQVDELTASTGHARFQKPIYHLYIAPNPADRMPTAAEIDDLWARLERELHLEEQPWAGVEHTLERALDDAEVVRHPSWGGQDRHEHRAYSLVGADGHMVDALKNDYIRRERIVMEWEFDSGFQLTMPGHPRVLMRWFVEHRPEIAAAMVAAELDPGLDLDPAPKPVADVQPDVRATLETAGVERMRRHTFNVRKDVLEAWRASDTAAAFEAALAERGYRLARGERLVMLVDPSGAEHKLAATIGTASAKLEGARTLAAEVNVRMDGYDLPTLDAARRAVREMEQAGQSPVPLAAPHYVPPAAPEEICDAKTDAAGQQDDDPRDLVGPGRDQGRGAGSAVAAGAAGCGQPGPGAGPVGGDRGPARPAGPAPGACRGRLVAGRQRLARHRRTELDALTARVRLGPPRPPPRHPAGPAKVQAAWQVAVAPFDPQYDSARRAQFKARLLSRAYDCGWLPPAVADNISWIDYDQQRQRVTLHLRSGGQLVDDGERITLVGDPSDVAVWEVVEAAARRGWDAIEVKGDAAFRREVAVRCALREPPIIVANYELSPADQDVVDLILAQRQAASLLPAVPSVDVALPTSRH